MSLRTLDFIRVDKLIAARKAARLLTWDSMLKNSDPTKRRLLYRVYQRLCD